jgi:hypothetical protein
MRVIRFHGREGQVQRLRAALWEPPHSWKDSWRRIRLSMEEYLMLQGRFRHLFEPTRQSHSTHSGASRYLLETGQRIIFTAVWR